MSIIKHIRYSKKKQVGAELIKRHEALQKFNDAHNYNTELSQLAQQERQKEITACRMLLGGLA
jgi:cellobiose-specific phosphotransferase system component IIA